MVALAEQVRANTSLERLRLVGAVLLALAIVLIDIRQTGEWSAFFRLVVAIVPCVALYLLAFSIAKPGEMLERWQTATALSALSLLFLALIELADMLGASGNVSSGNGFWVTAVIAIAAAVIAVRFRSPVHTLVAAIVLIVSLLFFIDWVGDHISLKAARNVLVLFTVVYWLKAYGIRRLKPDLDRLHSDYLVVVGGLAGIAAGSIGANSVGGILGSFLTTDEAGSANGWEFFLLAVSILLIYYTAWQGYRASAYLGLYGLSSFAVVAGSGSGIWGWPLLLLLVGLIALGASLAANRPDSPQTGEPQPPDTLPS